MRDGRSAEGIFKTSKTTPTSRTYDDAATGHELYVMVDTEWLQQLSRTGGRERETEERRGMEREEGGREREYTIIYTLY